MPPLPRAGSRMRKFEIITNTTKDPERSFEKEVCRFLSENGGEWVTRRTEGFEPDCMLVLGGDGTVLRAASGTWDRKLPILGINLGTLGYLAETEKENWKEDLLQLMDGCYAVENRMMIAGQLQGTQRRCDALNDIVIARTGALRIMSYDVYVNGKFLNTYHADGMIVCTPTGSTAYNLSAGGPIVEPGAEMMVLTPICPHQINIRSIVLSAKDRIEIVIGATSRESDLLAEADFDGNERVELHTGDRFVIEKSEKTTRLIKLERRSFLETLHRKMRVLESV